MKVVVRPVPQVTGIRPVVVVLACLMALVGLRVWTAHRDQVRLETLTSLPIGVQIAMWDENHPVEVPCMYVGGGIHSAGAKGDPSRPGVDVVQEFPSGNWRYSSAALCDNDAKLMRGASVGVLRDVVSVMREYEKARAKRSGAPERVVNRDVYIAEHTFLLADKPEFLNRQLNKGSARSDGVYGGAGRNSLMADID